MEKSEIREYYSNPKVLDAILEISKDREVVGRFEDGSYGKRPNIIQYSGDILKMVDEGVVSFHGSVERYSNPMLLSTEITKERYRQLRIGWDLILDIDSVCFEHSKIAVKLLTKALKFHGVEEPGLKFSGRRGFHMFVSFESFPKQVGKRKTVDLYPKASQIIVRYLKEMIREELGRRLIEFEGADKLFKAVGLRKDILEKEELDPFDFVEIEENWGKRHLFRLPFSIHEKTWLVSVPLELKDLDKFKPADAKPDRVKFKTFLKEPSDARMLLINAFDWYGSIKEERKLKREYKIPKRAINPKFFPPCLKRIENGLEDGRKRAVFVLITFLRNSGWNWDQIENFVNDWNQRNPISLRENYIKSQLEWHRRQKRSLLPPNCKNELFYHDTEFCNPDQICKQIKNPLTYPWKAMKRK